MNAVPGGRRLAAAFTGLLTAATLMTLRTVSQGSEAHRESAIQGDPPDGRDHLDVAVSAMGHGLAALFAAVTVVLLVTAAVLLVTRRRGHAGLVVGVVGQSLVVVWVVVRVLHGAADGGPHGTVGDVVQWVVLLLGAAAAVAALADPACRAWCARGRSPERQ